MKYKHFLAKLTCTDAVLDVDVKNKEEVEVSCNKYVDVPILFFKDGNKIVDCIVLK